MSRGDIPEGFSQAILEGAILVGRLGVSGTNKHREKPTTLKGRPRPLVGHFCIHEACLNKLWSADHGGIAVEACLFDPNI